MITDYVFRLDASIESTVFASRLALTCTPSAKHYLSFSDPNCFLKMSHPNAFVFIGSPSTVGSSNFTNNFVNRFDRKFTKRQRNEVLDIYFFMDPSMKRADIIADMQTITNQLYENGFCTITTHAFVPPEDIDDTVEVTLQLANPHSVYQRLTPNQHHLLNVYYLSIADAKELATLSLEPRKYYREIDVIKNKAYYVHENAHPIATLNLPQYTFIPHEKLEARRDRVRLNPIKKNYDRECQLRNNAFYDLDAMAQMASQNQTKIGPKLHQLADRVLHSAHDTWRNKINYAKNHFKKQNLIKNGDEYHSTLKKAQHANMNQPKENTLHRVMRTTDFSGLLHERSNAKKRLSELEIERNVLVEHLTIEVNELNKSCMFFFNSYEVSTKLQKIAALKSLTFDRVPDLKSDAERLFSDDRVMRCMKTTRTKDFLTKIMRIENPLAKNQPKLF